MGEPLPGTNRRSREQGQQGVGGGRPHTRGTSSKGMPLQLQRCSRSGGCGSLLGQTWASKELSGAAHHIVGSGAISGAVRDSSAARMLRPLLAG